MTPHPPSPDRPLTPGEALAKLFLDNADRGAHAANDELVDALRQWARAIQALTDPDPTTTPRPPRTRTPPRSSKTPTGHR